MTALPPILPTLSCIDELGEFDFEDIEQEGQTSILRVELGESADGRFASFLSAEMARITGESPIPGLKPFTYFAFGYGILLVDYHHPELSRFSVDRTETRPWIPHGQYQLVVDITCRCCSALTKLPEPDYIYRITFAASPTAAMLRKHVCVTETLQQNGYSVLKEGTDDHGHLFWLMGRSGLDLAWFINEAEHYNEND